FDYSPFTRPADDFFGHLDVNLDGAVSVAERTAASRFDGLDYLAALQGFQSFDVKNETTAAFDITQINKLISTTAIAVAAASATILHEQANGSFAAPAFPIHLAAGQAARFWTFYDPAVRSADHSTVTEQFPDWSGSKSTTNAPHTFPADDHLEVKTQVSAS